MIVLRHKGFCGPTHVTISVDGVPRGEREVPCVPLERLPGNVIVDDNAPAYFELPRFDVPPGHHTVRLTGDNGKYSEAAYDFPVWGKVSETGKRNGLQPGLAEQLPIWSDGDEITFAGVVETFVTL